jgi:hypothetical protein
MRPVSARFLAAVANGGSYRLAVRARVVSPGQNGIAPTDMLATLDLSADGTGGAVTFDSTADVLATLDLTTTAAFFPKTPSDPLTPYGNELFIERGVVYGDGSREWVSLGYFRINSVQQQQFGVNVDVTATDRMQGIIDARIPSPLTFAAGTPVVDVIGSLVEDVYDWAEFDLDASLTGKTLASAQVTTDDRYGFLNTLITSYGLVFFWDYRGIFVAKPPPDPSEPVVRIKSGQGGVLTSLSRTLNRDGVSNGVMASGEQLDDTIPPVSALVVDTDPNSPTWWDGPFGHVIQFYSSPLLTTNAQCVSAGTSILVQSTGLPYNVDFGQVPNPALEALDPVQIMFPGKRELHVLAQLVIPLDAATAQTAQTRQFVSGVFGRVG